MKNILTLLLVVLIFICCDNSGYSVKAYTKTRVKRVSVLKKDIIKENTISVKGNSISLHKEIKSYHIIAASSTSRRTANKLASVYKKSGYDISILASNGRYRISLGDFKTKEQANIKKKKFSLSLHKNDLWILKD